MKVKYFKSVFFSIIIFFNVIGCTQKKDDTIKKENKAKRIVREIMEMDIPAPAYPLDKEVQKRIKDLIEIGEPAILPILDSLTTTKNITNYRALAPALMGIGRPAVKYLCEVWGNDWNAYSTGLFVFPMIGGIMMDIGDPTGIQCIIGALHGKNIITKKFAKSMLAEALQESNAQTAKLICDQLISNGFNKTENYQYNTSKWLEWINSIPE